MKTTFILLLIAGMLVQSCVVTNHAVQHPGINKAIDPVCGMKTDTASAFRYHYPGNHIVYYFDSEECMKVFQKNPDKFVAAGHEGNHGMMHPMHNNWMIAAMIGTMAFMMGAVMLSGTWR